MKALTIYQPWASLIACGAKRFETRGWRTNYRGPIAIHAGKKPVLPWFQHQFEKDVRLKIIETVGNPVLLPRGAIIATAELVDCWSIYNAEKNGEILIGLDHGPDDPDVMFYTFGDLAYGASYENEALFGDYTEGGYAWQLDDVKLLPEPIPASGKQGLWNWEEQL